jgi:hypothetical protein
MSAFADIKIGKHKYCYFWLNNFENPGGSPINIFHFKLLIMPTEQYHEPAGELSPEVRTFARMIQSMIEEAEAINWYEQRISVEKDKEAKAIMENAQKEEFKHFSMDLEFLLRKKEDWRTMIKTVVGRNGDIVKNAEKGEDKID